MLRVVRRRARLEIGNIEVGQGVVDEAVHGPRLAEHVLVDQTRDEVRCKGDDKGLQRKRLNQFTNKRLAPRSLDDVFQVVRCVDTFTAV